MHVRLLILLLLTTLLHSNELETLLLQSAKPNLLLIFYTRWCPPCVDAIALGNDVAKHYGESFEVIGIDLTQSDTSQNLKPEFATCVMQPHDAAIYGVQDRIPVMVLMERENRILIKRYGTLPEPSLFMALIKRTAEGYLANGTLPIDQRVDLWKQKRQ